MSTDRDTTRIVRSWLRTDDNDSADRVLGTVLDRLDTLPQRRAIVWPVRRFLLMSTPLRWGAAAAAAAAFLIGVLIVSGNASFGIGSSTPSSSSPPSPSRSVAPSPTPVVSGSLPESGSVIQGSYTIADPFPIQLGIEVGPGWTMWSSGVMADGVAVYKRSPDPPAGLALGFLIVGNVHADPCDPTAGVMDPPVGPDPMDLAEAIVAQTGTDSTDPVPVEIDGYNGVFLDYRNTGEGECLDMERWPGRDALVGERDQVWILDVEGTRLVIDAASFEGTSDEDVAEMRTIVESMTIEP
jgi:hypothetical protein